MKLSKITVFASIVALSGCANTGTYLTEIKPETRGTAFGTATVNNMAVQSGNISQSMVTDLTRKFANEAPATINFAFNSSQLDAQAKSALQRQAAWIKAHPQIAFTVFGHTDKVGGDSFNNSLGKRRADAAVRYLISQGVGRSQVRGTSSLGESRPLVLTEGPNRQNRRTVTEVSGFGSHKKGGQLDGRYAQTIYDRYIKLENQAIITDAGGLIEDTTKAAAE